MNYELYFRKFTQSLNWSSVYSQERNRDIKDYVKSLNVYSNVFEHLYKKLENTSNINNNIRVKLELIKSLSEELPELKEKLNLIEEEIKNKFRDIKEFDFFLILFGFDKNNKLSEFKINGMEVSYSLYLKHFFKVLINEVKSFSSCLDIYIFNNRKELYLFLENMLADIIFIITILMQKAGISKNKEIFTIKEIYKDTQFSQFKEARKYIKEYFKTYEDYLKYINFISWCHADIILITNTIINVYNIDFKTAFISVLKQAKQYDSMDVIRNGKMKYLLKYKNNYYIYKNFIDILLKFTPEEKWLIDIYKQEIKRLFKHKRISKNELKLIILNN